MKYIAFYKNEKIEIEAKDSYSAVLEARIIFKTSKKNSSLVHVELCEREDGEQIEHKTGGL